MRKADVEAVGALAGQRLSAFGGFVEGMHSGIAGRPFRILGVAAAPVRAVHDGVSERVYGGVRRTLAAGAHGVARLGAARASGDGPALIEAPRASLGLAALNGLYGNHLTAAQSAIAFGMDLREDPEAGEPTRRLAVFVHGLGETDRHWRGRFGRRLRAELGFTPLHLRYNTGLHISDNGRALSAVLQDVVDGWPAEVEEIVLVGHSMGGLVVRSACHYGERDGLDWTGTVRHVFCLGSPHLGADLEKGVNAVAHVLAKLPETRPLASVLNARSAGIKDLRYGACLEEDWSGCDPDEFLRDRCNEVPFLPCARYYFIGATLGRGPLGSLVGDLLVRMPSASGRGNGTGRSIPFAVEDGHELAGMTHFDLLTHPAVYEQLRLWLTRRT